MKSNLFDPVLLESLDFSPVESYFNPVISAAKPGNGLLVRPLRISDYNAGFLELLGQLTEVGEVSEGQFLERFNSMKSLEGTYYVTVIENKNTGQVIGAGTLLIERKFIHGCAIRGRLEDIVVSDKYRGKQLGKLIVTTLTLLAKRLNCYKVTLDCRDQMRPFYESLGYKKEEGNSNFMQIRYKS